MTGPSTPQQAEVGPALKVQRLSKRFDGAVAPVWSEISFEVPSGQSVAIIGGNGTGKSTLLRCCLRLIEPNDGDVHLHGEKLTGSHARQLRRMRSNVGFVFQKHNLVPRLSVLSNVLHGGMARSRGPRHWHHALASKEDREYAMHCLEQVSLAHLAERRADHLSGGQSQRVAVARALMQKPRTIFADEPVASLDPQGRPGGDGDFRKAGARPWTDPGIRFAPPRPCLALRRAGAWSAQRETGSRRHDGE